MMKEVTAIFDIGKTNKKIFLFDKQYQEVFREYAQFGTIRDEDGHPTEDLSSLQEWLRRIFKKLLGNKEYNITAINFSSYGASLVHLDKNGKVLTPLYNYTKPINPELIAAFYQKYGPEKEFACDTGATVEGMLNAGLQLYSLKHERPIVFNQIATSMHLPQYLSYLFTGIPLSEYTSIGCHTSLWDYTKNNYHDWVYKEGIDKILPPIVPTATSITTSYGGKRIKIGVGIHDSSAALLPYVRSIKKKFILVSTGTWSVSLNPFAEGRLSKEDISKNCINYMRVNGKPVKAARLFLGNEYKTQVMELSNFYHVEKDKHKNIRFDSTIYNDIIKNFRPLFRWTGFCTSDMPSTTIFKYDSYEYAYHHLMMELVKFQVESIKLSKGDSSIKRLYIDGGFSNNDVYIKLLSRFLKNMELRTTDSSLGSALGAALVISDARLDSKFLKRNYSLKKHNPFITE
ncbi:FGGY-family carbohydrate kinase [Flagellimonas sp. S174]|uniref:FGGY-family carbohydrate kinase n=1 Tax=Flagellimonas sp. S174 TaxID=3410790 RepID=UPI003BF593C7